MVSTGVFDHNIKHVVHDGVTENAHQQINAEKTTATTFEDINHRAGVTTFNDHDTDVRGFDGAALMVA